MEVVGVEGCCGGEEVVWGVGLVVVEVVVVVVMFCLCELRVEWIENEIFKEVYYML